MAGFVLSGSGIRVFVFGNMGLGWGGWGKVQVNDGGGWGCGRDGGVVCVVYWRCLKGAVVRLTSYNGSTVQCTLEGVEVVVGKLH